MQILKSLKVVLSIILDVLLTRTTADGVQYIWRRHGSKTLVVVFTGMGPQRYNYKTVLRRCPYDLLFIRDSWAGGASYYWYENGQNHPEMLTQKAIEQMTERGGYDTLITVGSSKGGTAAVYYGLKYNADAIYAGACQYYVGQYLAIHEYVEKPHLWRAVVGQEPTEEWTRRLDRKLPDMIEAHRESKTEIYLVYSTEEHTYADHIAPLIAQLDACHIRHHDQVEHFKSHDMIGKYFKATLYNRLVAV